MINQWMEWGSLCSNPYNGCAIYCWSIQFILEDFESIQLRPGFASTPWGSRVQVLHLRPAMISWACIASLPCCLGATSCNQHCRRVMTKRKRSPSCLARRQLTTASLTKQTWLSGKSPQYNDSGSIHRWNSQEDMYNFDIFWYCIIGWMGSVPSIFPFSTANCHH